MKIPSMPSLNHTFQKYLKICLYVTVTYYQHHLSSFKYLSIENENSKQMQLNLFSPCNYIVCTVFFNQNFLVQLLSFRFVNIFFFLSLGDIIFYASIYLQYQVCNLYLHTTKVCCAICVYPKLLDSNHQLVVSVINWCAIINFLFVLFSFYYAFFFW